VLKNYYSHSRNFPEAKRINFYLTSKRNSCNETFFTVAQNNSSGWVGWNLLWC
jgi:hypothetical protein